MTTHGHRTYKSLPVGEAPDAQSEGAILTRPSFSTTHRRGQGLSRFGQNLVPVVPVLPVGVSGRFRATASMCAGASPNEECAWLTLGERTAALRQCQGGRGGILGAAEGRRQTGRRLLCEGSQEARVIITVTPNAAVDKTLTVPNFQTGFRHRASESLTLPGGKGVNIARALKTLGEPVVVTGLVGGRAGQQIVEGLQRENILNDFVHIGGESRTSTAVVDPTTMTQTEVVEYGPVVTELETGGAAGQDRIPGQGRPLRGARGLAAAQGLRGLLLRGAAAHPQAPLLRRPRQRRRAASPRRPRPPQPGAAQPARGRGPGRPRVPRRPGPGRRHRAWSATWARATSSSRPSTAAWRASRWGASSASSAPPSPRSRPSSAPSALATPSSPVSSAARFRKLDLAECLRHALAAGAASTQRYGAGVLDAGLTTELLRTTEVEELGLRS